MGVELIAHIAIAYMHSIYASLVVSSESSTTRDCAVNDAEMIVPWWTWTVDTFAMLEELPGFAKR